MLVFILFCLRPTPSTICLVFSSLLLFSPGLLWNTLFFSPLHLQRRNRSAIDKSLDLVGKGFLGASAVEACQP